jgi:hypothetical protein
METGEVTGGVKRQHVLLEREIESLVEARRYGYCGWERWKELFFKAETKEELIGLLHFGFDVASSREEQVECVCLYLEVADGFRSFASVIPRESNHWRDPDGSPYVKSRQEIAQKARKMLCDKFFKTVEDKNYLFSWVPLIVERAVFEKLIWFFRERSYFGNLPDCNPLGKENHQDEICRAFLQEFIRFVWRNFDLFRGRDFRGNWTSEQIADATAMFRQARPATIEMLDYLKETNRLLFYEYRGDIFDIGAENWQKLEDLALMRGADGKVRFETIEAAVLIGPRIADVLILLRIILKEEERQKAIKEAVEARREAEAALAGLGVKK